MQKVRVYWNLHKKVWSVQDVKSGRVCDHLRNISLTDAKFVVRKGGQKRVREEGKKNVHAFAVGYIADKPTSLRTYNWYSVSYNPYKHDYFMIEEDEVPKDWVGNIHMKSLHHKHGVSPRVYV